MSQKRKSRKGSASAQKKGRLVENIVAKMHDRPGVSVETRKRLPVRGPSGHSGRTSEIDILITANVVGYPVQIAVECKNYRKRIDAPKINEFIGKLKDVGISCSHGIYVSVKGFTKGAVERAREAGIQPLVLTGLSEDRLSAAVQDAFQSVVYLLPVLTNIMVTTEVKVDRPEQLLVFFDHDGHLCGFVPDLVWRKWLQGYPPSALGEYTFDVAVPSGWHQVVDGKLAPSPSISVCVEVLGLVVTLEGSVTQHALLSAEERQIKKLIADVSFDVREGKYPVTTFHSESALDEFTRTHRGMVQLTLGRIRLPRILRIPFFWPPSQRIVEELGDLAEAYKAGEITDPASVDLSKIEGDDLSAVWEPIWAEHPILKAMVLETRESQ